MEKLCDESTLVIKLLKVQIELKSFGFFFNMNLMLFFNFCKQSLGFEHNLQNSDHPACLAWSKCLAMYSLNLRLPTCTLGVPIFKPFSHLQFVLYQHIQNLCRASSL